MWIVHQLHLLIKGYYVEINIIFYLKKKLHFSLGNLLLTGCHSNLLTIYKNESGEIISQTILPDAIEGTACISECHKWAIIGCNDGNIYCIIIDSGTIFWTFSTGSSVKSTPMLTFDKGKIIFGSYDKYLYCLNVKVSVF